MTASSQVDHNPPQLPRLQPPTIVDSSTTFSRLQQELVHVNRIAVDSESNSLFAYHEQVCLIQISSNTKDFLIDPIRLADSVDFDFLGSLFANPQIEKVLHAAEYDVMTLRRDFGFSFTNLFDTMIAARILGLERVGLGALLEERFSVKADKRHQRANWGKRPLTSDMIRYAQMDTHYLLPLRDELNDQLQQGGNLDEARELFDEVAEAKWSGTEFDPNGFWRINGVNHLSLRKIAILEILYQYREQQAQQRDLPVFKIMPDEALLNLAVKEPGNFKELADVPGISQHSIDRYGSDLLSLIKQGLQAPLPQRPTPRDQFDEVVQRRFESLHTWRKERAAKRGVSSEVILSKDALWELAQHAPQTLEELAAIRGIGPWRAQTYGDELLAILAALDTSTL